MAGLARSYGDLALRDGAMKRPSNLQRVPARAGRALQGTDKAAAG